MPGDEFDSLFEDKPVDDKQSKEIDELFTFEEHLPPEPAKKPAKSSQPARPQKGAAAASGPAPSSRPARPQKKRTSEDFQPDMDALVITAQSPLIIEGIKCLSLKDFGANTLQIYTEAMRGVEVFIKILERNPNNYFKLSVVINSDTDCKEIESVAFRLYKMKFREVPETESHILKAYEMLRNRLKIGYNKALVSTSMLSIKKYFHQSGVLDQEKISQMIAANSAEMREDVLRYTQHMNIAMQLMKIGDFEITRGLRGRDLNTFAIRASSFLASYYQATGDAKSEDYYRRTHENYKKYFVIREPEASKG